jgi:hypothetical protein
MTNTNIIIIIILILLIFLNIYLINKEHFDQTSQSTDNCAFNPNLLNIESKSQCLEECLKSTDCSHKESCIGICNSFVPLNVLKCEPTNEELKSNTKNQCIQQCKDLELLGCNYYKFKDENGESKLNPYSLNFNTDCSNDLSELLSNPKQNCNPCIKKCNECPEDLCPFNDRSNSDSSGQLNQCNLTNPIDLNKKFDNEQFIIQGIPEDNKITLYWNVVSLQDIKEFKIIITNKTNNNNISFMGSLEAIVGSTLMGGCEQTDNGYRCAFIKDGLINDNSYNVVVNAISDSLSGQQPNIKISNTINLVPRKINYTNFELNDESCGKFETYKKTSIFNDLLGKTLEFNL